MKLEIIYILLINCWLGFNISAQEDGLIQQLRIEEQTTLEAIALYPEKERQAILEVSKHPEVLVRLQNLQYKTSSDFRSLISNLSESDQSRIYDLTRYPELINEICEGNTKKSKKEMLSIVGPYPESVQVSATYLHKDHFDLLLKINHMYRTSDQAFENTISPYPVETQEAYRVLLKLPEVMSVLTDNLNMTVLLGDLYRSKPQQLKAELDSLNLVVAEQKARELNEWQESLENDPQAMAEYQQAAQEFAEENAYAESSYAATYPDNYTSDLTIYHVWQPYPYWFGCPWWYTYDCWYPYPWWYHWGYYYGPGNVMIFVCMPSSYFVYWHMYNHSHFYHYPYFTNHLITYHNHDKGSVTSVGSITSQWIRENEPKLPRNWLRDDKGRPERIKELGKFNNDYDQALNSEGNGGLTQREFLERNAATYPNLKALLKEKPIDMENKDRNVDIIRKEPVKEIPKTAEKERSKVIDRPQSNQQEIERAKTHHQNTWETPRPTQRPPAIRQVPRSNPPVRQQTKPPVQPRVKRK